MSSFQNAQEFYRRSLKGFAALHGLIYRALRNIGTLKMVFFFLPLICWWCCYTLKRTPGFSTQGDLGQGKLGQGEADSSSNEVAYGAGACHHLPFSIAFVSKLRASNLRVRNREGIRMYVGFIHHSPSLYLT